jgi:hypothetical protein
MKSSGSLVALVIALLIFSGGVHAFADPLQGASKQRIGNYDFEMTTEPKAVSFGEPTTIMLRIAGVNGDDLIDVPLVIRLMKDGVEVYRSNPIIVPFGHHDFQYTFAEPGRYALYVDLRDYAYSGETLTFTFPINAAGPADYVTGMLPIAGGVAAAAVGGAVIIKKRKNSPQVSGKDS